MRGDGAVGGLADAPAARVTPADAMRVVVLAPTGRDGAIAARVLGDAAIEAVAVADMPALCAAFDSGIGAAVIAEEALTRAAMEALLEALAGQPAWSDVPVVVLMGEGELSRALPRPLELLAARSNVTLLERPVRVPSLVTVLRAALNARQRQYDVRRHLEERARLLASEREAREVAESAAARADEANRAKSEFLAMMSHELRTPLNAIAGYAELLELGVRGPVNAEQQVDLDRIRRSQRHLLSLIDDVLNFAKLEAGRVEFLVEDVAVRDALLDVEALVLPQLTTKGLRYVGADQCGDLAVAADGEKFRQVLVNLLSNAIKFTPPGGQIRVACGAEGEVVRTEVSDEGIGIPPEKVGSVFEPFVQVESSLASRQEGTGLGLAISRDLARRMGGDLEVRSEVGRGSVFTLTLPRAGALAKSPA